MPAYRITLTSPDSVEYDITDRVSLDGLSRLTLAVERNLHAFRAGDLSLTLDDGDGFFSGLFDGIDTSDRWRLRAERDGVLHFSGTIVPIDSIHFDRKEHLVEVTAMDLSKALEDIPADTVSRSVSLALTATASAGTNTLTLASTASLYAGDEIHLSASGFNPETVEIALVLSATQVQLTQNLANTFGTAAILSLATPFHRHKTPEWLINSLLDEAGSVIAGRVLRLDGPTGRVPIFSDQSTNRLDQTTVPTSLLQKDGNEFAGFAATSFEQAGPADDWTSVATPRNWIDWTPYRTQAQGEPATHANSPSGDPDLYGVDFTPGALVAYFVTCLGGTPRLLHLYKYTSADGLTWTGPTLHALLKTLGVGFSWVGWAGDYDSTRNRYYYAGKGDDGTLEYGYYDIAAAAKTVLSAAEYVTAIRYSAEADAVLAFNLTSWKVEQWRDAAKIQESPAFSHSGAPTIKQARYLNGAWIMPGYALAVPTVFFSDDGMVSFIQIPLSEAITVSAGSGLKATIVDGQSRIACTAMPGQGDQQTKFYVGSPAFSGVVPYADFEGQSVANALDDLAILLNGVFFVDVQGVAYFVLRDLDSGSPVATLDDLVLEREEDPIWVETYDYVAVSVGNGEAGAGVKTSTSRNLEVDIQLAVSLGVGTAAAFYLLSFYEKRRRVARVTLEDRGEVYRLLDPVSLDGISWIIYSVERDLGTYEVSAELLEKVAR